ncbi:hypothetical protein EV191_13123 [Tamaricihabitans halophyticus]|uniref:Uncharacterized protein n=1 Tax=Tamaricihabitans halophyticus TaxID=1262583 RepID=A0A4R2PT99_9PSEU|nr:hypothetical protein [Tamaricihabitans halophyticus]TCP39223.1 hypothetical protein EV191_13123 [Tamaricihabitans halophyticus]
MTPEETPRPEPQDEPWDEFQSEHVTEQSPVEAVEAAVGALDGLDELPLDAHVERFDSVHTALTVALSSIDKV